MILMPDVSIESVERTLVQIGFTRDMVTYRRPDGIHVTVGKRRTVGVRINAHRDIYRGLIHQTDYKFNSGRFLEELRQRVKEERT